MSTVGLFALVAIGLVLFLWELVATSRNHRNSDKELGRSMARLAANCPYIEYMELRRQLSRDAREAFDEARWSHGEAEEAIRIAKTIAKLNPVEKQRQLVEIDKYDSSLMPIIRLMPIILDYLAMTESDDKADHVAYRLAGVPVEHRKAALDGMKSSDADLHAAVVSRLEQLRLIVGEPVKSD